MNTTTKPPALSTEQRLHLASISIEPGKVYQKRSALIASLVRKGYVTTESAGFGELQRTGWRSAGRPALVAATITAAGAARLALKRGG